MKTPIIELIIMKKTDIERRLEIMDRELHSMLSKVRSGKRIPLKELKDKISSRAKESDTTEFVSKMRKREY